MSFPAKVFLNAKFKMQNAKLQFSGEFATRNELHISMYAFSFTRLRAGAPSRREPWGAGQNHLSGNGFPRGKG